MATIGYARVSSTDQSLDVQIEQLTAAGCDQIFSEKRSGTTARQDDRPELARAIRALRRDDVFAVTRLDRLARSMSDFFKILVEIDKRGAVFKCVLQPELDMTTANGRLVAGILAVIAQFETEVRSQRQREGIERAKAKGTYTKYAHRNIKMRKAHELLEAGIPYRDVAEAVNMHENTIRNRWPGYYERAPMNGSHRKGLALKETPATLPPSAVETVEPEPTPKPTAPRPGLFGRFHRLGG